MKTQSHHLNRIILLTTIALLFLFTATPALAAPSRVAILPFDMHAEKDLTFLQEGILDMLGSRLAWKDKVEVINENETKAALESIEGFEGESRALLAGGKLKADYVLFGSLTVFGESVSIDAKMADVSGQQEPLPFFAQTRGMGEVIPKINEFATNINATVFGRSVARRPAAAPAAQAGIAPAPQVQPAPPVQDSRMHPEKLLQSGVQSEAQVPIAGQPYQTPNPAFVSTAPAVGSANHQNYWQSRNYKVLITGLATGDVNNDGKVELVMVSDKFVSVYQVTNGRMVKIADAAETGTNTYISVDVGDVNANGTPEIYVTSLGAGLNTVESFVLEYTDGNFDTLTSGDNWFYRVSKTVSRGEVLLGQRMRVAEESIFHNPVHEMNWQGDRIVPGPQVLAGRKTNVMGVAYDDITHTGQSTLVGYNDWDRLRLYGSSGNLVWEDGDRTGGNKLFYNLPKIDVGEPNRQFFPMRVRTADINRDGKPEVMVASHDELAKSMLKNFRYFKKGHIESKVWNGLGLVSQWKTQSLSGRIGDFVVGDFDNDGDEELVIALIAKEGSVLFTDSISRLIAFDLE